jgi:excisionase family DNA binding protein
VTALNSDDTSKRFFDNLPDLMTIDEAASFLGKDPKTIRNYIATRTFPFVRNGNRYMVFKDSLRTWLRQKEFVPWQSHQ